MKFLKAAGWFGKGAALPDAVTGQATRAPEKPYMIVLDASISTRRVSYGPKSAYGPPGRVSGRVLAFSQSVTRQSMFLNAAPCRRARRCSRGGTRVLSHPRSSAAAMSTAAARRRKRERMSARMTPACAALCAVAQSGHLGSCREAGRRKGGGNPARERGIDPRTILPGFGRSRLAGQLKGRALTTKGPRYLKLIAKSWFFHHPITRRSKSSP